MEIPDVIAINKMDHPAAKTMLNEVRSILSLDNDRDVEAADRAHRGDARRERRRAVGEDRGAPRVPRGRRQLEERRRRESRAARCSRSRRRGRRRTWSTRSRDDPELRRLLDEVQRRELDPLTRRSRDHGEGVPDWRRERHPRFADVEQARERLDGVARVTPVYGSETLRALAGREVWLKAENLQRTGSFKVRGAVNKIATLTPEERAAGVVAASAGNHGAGRRVGGARGRLDARDLHAAGRADGEGRGDAELRRGDRARRRDVRRRARAARARTPRRRGATFIHPFEDDGVIAGQGTIGLELVEQMPDVGTVVIPIGGGGLASGIAIALRGAEARAAHRRRAGGGGTRAGRSPASRSRTGSRSRSPAS